MNTPTHLQTFLGNQTPAEKKRIFAGITKAIEIVEYHTLPGLTGAQKKAKAKEIAKALIDIPNFPDWIEDAFIDLVIDILCASLFRNSSPDKVI